MKEVLQSKLLGFICFVDKIKEYLLTFLVKNIKVIVPVLVITFIIVPKIFLSVVVMIVALILAIIIIKKAIYYFFIATVFFFKLVIGTFAVFVAVGGFLLILQAFGLM